MLSVTMLASTNASSLSQLSGAARPLRERLATIGRTWATNVDGWHAGNPSGTNKDNTKDEAGNYDDEASSNAGRSLRGFGRGFGGRGFDGHGFGGYRGYGYGRGASFATGLAVGGITGAAVAGDNNYNNYNNYNNNYNGYYTD
jgi:hypothetical protein